MLPALTGLLLLQLVGEVLARWFQWPVPGPVVGMALALAVLRLFPRLLAQLRPTAQGLLSHLSLLFVPAGVGVMLHLRRLGDEALAIGVALVLSTLISMAVTALVATWLMRWVRPQPSADGPNPATATAQAQARVPDAAPSASASVPPSGQTRP